MMMKQHDHQEQGYFVEENLSNLTSPISGEASVSSSSNTNNKGEPINSITNNIFSHRQQREHYFCQQQESDDQEHSEQPPAKKKRNMPGNPDPESEVISLSPKTLLATNRFICEICSKRFQRDQNLQLHRRGHNLPWKLKQRSKTEVTKKKVYVCPETTCVHHDPSRALGDLTGIKKHFSRKHGEKKWKCDKCSKRYAVHSDWKAHSKVCGTREYRCDCGTLFSRRDSFITHRTFCDILAEETARAIPSHQLLSNPTPSNSQFMTMQQQQQHALQLMNMQQQQQQHQHDSLPTFPVKIEHNQHHDHHNNLINLPPWLSCQPPIDNMPHHHINLSSSSSSLSSMFANQNHTTSTMVGPTFLTTPVSVSPPHMSATALLQKATQMGATMSKTSQQQQIQGHVTDNPSNTTVSRDNQQETTSSRTNTNTSSGVILNHGLSSFGNINSTTPTTNCGPGPGSGSGSGPMFLQDMMVNNSLSSSYDDAFGIQGPSSLAFHQTRGGISSGHGDGGNGGNDGLTRDFFGIKTTW